MESELRKDLISHRWVLISPKRGKRPSDFKVAGGSLQKQQHAGCGSCAFCYGHEQETGPEVLAFQELGCRPNEPCWRVRVVQNKFPAVSPDLEGLQSGPGTCCAAARDERLVHEGCTRPGIGAHEVVIETPHHDEQLAALSVDRIAEVLQAYQQRLEGLSENSSLKYCQIFKNNGQAAGASMAHSHSQIIALPVVPKALEDELQGARTFYEKKAKCVFCELIQFDLTEGKARLIDQSEQFISVAPFAARFPYETWILPRKHNPNFASVVQDEVKGLAEILKLTLSKMNEAFDDPPYNFMLQTAPLQELDAPYYHWYIRIVPHLITVAGFELGSGCHINPVSPEQAAEFLRDMKMGVSKHESTSDNGATDVSEAGGTELERVVQVAELGGDLNDQRAPEVAIHLPKM